MYYLKDYVDAEKLLQCITILIFDDTQMRENSMEDIIRRVENSFKDKRYLERISTSRQRWIDEDIEDITDGIITFLKQL